MVNIPKLLSALAAFSVFENTVAHPGEAHNSTHVRRELQMRDHLATYSKQSLGKCENSLKARELKSRATARRAAIAKDLREKRGLSTTEPYKRDLTELRTYEEINHQQSNTGYTLGTDETTIFSANTSCVLGPENVIGPYYVLGEYIRSDVTEGQAGVPVHLEMQFIDTSTCEPIKNVITDIWACNSTGVYSGINGEGGLNSTFLRGVQISDNEGVVQFDTIFPGHYTGRATHEHVVTHLNGTVLPNGTYTGGTVNHIGQLYFDENLRAAIELTSPYNLNTQEVVTNDEDFFAPEAASAAYDPFPEYVLLGDSLSDGLLMWISVGLNTTANYNSLAQAAAVWGAGGGVSTGNGGFPGPGGNSTGNWTGPGGPGPSGGPRPSRRALYGVN
ncbi:hypothetical protein B7494_g3467 [Chlorociboria aeruginascens]|nr:hypothetical protein B7494_g3467 [Chlorociboria aeruginascens]